MKCNGKKTKLTYAATAPFSERGRGSAESSTPPACPSSRVTLRFLPFLLEVVEHENKRTVYVEV